MTSERIRRQQAQREKLKTLREYRDEIAPYRISSQALTTVSSSMIGEMKDVLGNLTRSQQQELAQINAPIAVSTEEAETLLLELRSRWDARQMDFLLSTCRSSVLSSVVGPFGLGSIVAKLDKDGGNVTTIHNAKQNFYAQPEDKYCRTDYAGSKYTTARNKYKDGRIIENSQMIQDEYSGDFFDYSQTDCDHIKPANSYHQEGGFMQSKEQRKRFGADPDNFAMTSTKGNRSMGDKGKKIWQKKVATDGGGRTNKEVHGHDNRRVNAAIKRGDEIAEKYAPDLVEKTVFYGKNAARTEWSEAGKMGQQQSMGVLLVEFFSASFDEISDSYENGFRDGLTGQGFFEALRLRLARISDRVAARWKDAALAFKDGAISGFLSNLVTMLVNMLVTTGKRMVRVIREGFMSIMKAMKMALFPPEGMTRAEAADAALKLLATGVTVSIGIVAEEVIEKVVGIFFSANMPLLSPLASTVSAVIVGAMTGIASALIVYGIDRLDVFGVNKQRKHDYVLRELDKLLVESDRNIEVMCQDEMGRMGAMMTKLQGG